MCRLALYIGPPIVLSKFITEPTHSIILQSEQADEKSVTLNGDGFGVAWFSKLSLHPALFREITPAWSNNNLREIARVTQSECICVHVRKASVGLPVVETNSHPFVYREFAFMHNGGVAHFSSVKRRLINMLSQEAFLSIKGTTDSEHMFALFLDFFYKYTAEAADKKQTIEKVQAMERAMLSVIQTVEELAADHIAKHNKPTDEPEAISFLNLVVTDGTSVVATRYTVGHQLQWHTLAYCRGRHFNCHHGRSKVERCDEHPADEECGAGDQHPGMLIVSSEALTADDDFEEIPENSILVAKDANNVEIKEIKLEGTKLFEGDRIRTDIV